MTSSDLVTFGAIGASLARTVEANRLSPSYLFEGADEETLREAALTFAEAVLTRGADDEAAARLRRRLRAGTHPDLHVCGKDKPTVISVAALTAVLAQAHRTPMEGPRQIFLVDPADAMEAEGIARYLKTLEEPPEACVFLLVSSRPDRLPATVLSRVKRIRIPPLSRAALVARLAGEGVSAEAAERAAARASGSLARARRLASADVVSLADACTRAACGEEPEVGRVVDGVLSALDHAATELAARDPSGADVKRECVRTLLADLVHVLSTLARDRAADMASSALPPAVSPDAALDLLARLGELSVAIPANITPAVLLVEIVRAVRDASSR